MTEKRRGDFVGSKVKGKSVITKKKENISVGVKSFYGRYAESSESSCDESDGNINIDEVLPKLIEIGQSDPLIIEELGPSVCEGDDKGDNEGESSVGDIMPLVDVLRPTGTGDESVGAKSRVRSSAKKRHRPESDSDFDDLDLDDDVDDPDYQYSDNGEGVTNPDVRQKTTTTGNVGGEAPTIAVSGGESPAIGSATTTEATPRHSGDPTPTPSPRSASASATHQSIDESATPVMQSKSK